MIFLVLLTYWPGFHRVVTWHITVQSSEQQELFPHSPLTQYAVNVFALGGANVKCSLKNLCSAELWKLSFHTARGKEKPGISLWSRCSLLCHFLTRSLCYFFFYSVKTEGRKLALHNKSRLQRQTLYCTTAKVCFANLTTYVFALQSAPQSVLSG